jgi:hypothetical protein
MLLLSVHWIANLHTQCPKKERKSTKTSQILGFRVLDTILPPIPMQRDSSIYFNPFGHLDLKGDPGKIDKKLVQTMPLPFPIS